jgi:hypothetical protein
MRPCDDDVQRDRNAVRINATGRPARTGHATARGAGQDAASSAGGKAGKQAQ